MKSLTNSVRAALTEFPGVTAATAIGLVALIIFPLQVARGIVGPLGYAGFATAVLLLVDHSLVRFVNGVYYPHVSADAQELDSLVEDVLRAVTSVASVAVFLAFGTEFQTVVVFAGTMAAILYVLVYSMEKALSKSWTGFLLAILLCTSGLIGTLEITVAAAFTSAQYGALVVMAVVAAAIALCWEKYGPPSRADSHRDVR